jgi:hypothetical protein
VYGRALIGRDERELAAQLGQQVNRLCEEHGIARADALAEVTEATRDALRGGRVLDKNALHAEYRKRVRAELMPWCRGCGSHHVAPILWRYAVVAAGTRLDSERRYRAARTGRADPAEAARRFLRFYGPADHRDFAAWAGMTPRHAQRLWDEIADNLVQAGGAWLLRDDASALESPPSASGIRLLPPGDPYLQKPNRELLAPDPALHKRMFRPVASPGAVLRDGRLAGLWKARAKGRKLEITVEKLGRLARADVEDEAQRVATLRGASEASVAVG